MPAAGIDLVAEYSETLIMSGAISGAGGITIHTEEGGLVRFEGSTPNTYTGATKVLGGGGLVLKKSAGTVAVPAGLLVGTSSVWAKVVLNAPHQIQGNVSR